MQTTSHFIGIDLKSEIFSNIFTKVYKYLKENNIENSLFFQNPLSLHITLYYLENDIKLELKEEIKNHIKDFDIKDIINITGFNYFFRGEGNRFILYFTTKTNLALKDYRNTLHKIYNRDYIEDNNFNFSPHITFLRIKDSTIFEKYKENIENIINNEIKKICYLDINTRKMFLYAVNSEFKEEIQIKL